MLELAANYESDSRTSSSSPSPSPPPPSGSLNPAYSEQIRTDASPPPPTRDFFGLCDRESERETGTQFWNARDTARLRQLETDTSGAADSGVPHSSAAAVADGGRKRKRGEAAAASRGLTWNEECELELSRKSMHRDKEAGGSTVILNSAAASRGSPAPLTSSVEGQQQPEQQPKLFYVHHRVAPYLSSKRAEHGAPKSLADSFTAHGGAVNRIKWCVREEYSHLAATASMDGTAKVWNLLSRSGSVKGGGGQVAAAAMVLSCHSKAVKDVNWSSCGTRLLTSGYDRSAALTDLRTGAVVYHRWTNDFVLCNAFQPISDDVAILGGDSALFMVDFRMPTSAPPVMRYSHKDKFGQVQDVIFDRRGETFFSSGSAVSRESADMSVMAWDVRTGAVLSNQMYQEHYTCVRLKLHPVEAIILAQSCGNYIALFSERSPFRMNRHKRYESHRVDGYAVGFDISSDGKFVSSGSADGNLYIYHGASSKLIATMDGGIGCRGNACLDVALHSLLPSTAATCYWGGSVILWR